jgi:hypothetical protein
VASRVGLQGLGVGKVGKPDRQFLEQDFVRADWIPAFPTALAKISRACSAHSERNSKGNKHRGRRYPRRQEVSTPAGPLLSEKRIYTPDRPARPDQKQPE